MVIWVLSFLAVTYMTLYAAVPVQEVMDLVDTIPQSFRFLLWTGGLVNLMIMVIIERIVTLQLLKQENL